MVNFGAESERKKDDTNSGCLAENKQPNHVIGEVVQSAEENAPTEEVDIDGQLRKADTNENGGEKLTVAVQHLTANFVVLSELIAQD